MPETFPDPTIDDVSLLTKRTAEGIYDITLVETTCMNMGHSSDFDNAVKKANGKLTDGNSFILAIDVKRARHSGIRPIPQRTLHGQVWGVEEKETDIQRSAVHATPQSINPYDLSGNETQAVITKQLLWERRLLDLSLRNNLLNIRITKNTLQLIPANLSCLEDALADGEEFRILHRPADWESPAMDFGIYSSIPESDPMVGFINSELSQKRLRFYLPENDLGKALTHLYRSSRTSIEENGANTLYLALGLLKWYETPSSERPRYAPILLLPVEIIRKSAAKGYVIRSREEETMMNITLLEMLRQNFGISISGLDTLPIFLEAGGDGAVYNLLFRDSRVDGGHLFPYPVRSAALIFVEGRIISPLSQDGSGSLDDWHNGCMIGGDESGQHFGQYIEPSPLVVCQNVDRVGLAEYGFCFGSNFNFQFAG